MDKRIIELEEKSAHQEHLIQELNEVIIMQQKQIAEVEKSVQQLREYVRGLGEQQGGMEQEAPPPHY